MKYTKKKLTKNEYRMKKRSKAIREELKNCGMKVSAKSISNL
jgi:hypothetical protein